MREPIFQGTCTAIITPFDRDGCVNRSIMEGLVERQIKMGIDALCVCGTTGEFSTLTVREYLTAVDICVKVANHRVKVIAGSGNYDTQKSIYLSQHVEDLGVDALLVVAPFFTKPNQLGLLKHYNAITNSVKLPIILYNVPDRTGISFSAQTYQLLSDNPQINGVKEASGDFDLLMHTKNFCGPDFHIWCGHDKYVVPMMTLGAEGVISAAANVIPQIMLEMSHLCLKKDFATAAKIQLEYIDLVDALFGDTNPITVKMAMDLMNLKAGKLRLPLCDPSEESVRHLTSVLKYYQLI